jgi:N utilization substance protein A
VVDPEGEAFEVVAELEAERASGEEDDKALEELVKDEKKKQEKKKAFRQVEYDPDRDVTIVKRRRKRDAEDWSEEDDW